MAPELPGQRLNIIRYTRRAFRHNGFLYYVAVMAGLTVGLVLSCCRDTFSIGCCRAEVKIRFRSVLFPRKCHNFVKNRCQRIDRRLRCGVCTTRRPCMRNDRPNAPRVRRGADFQKCETLSKRMTLKTARSDESRSVAALIQRFERLATSDWEPK